MTDRLTVLKQFLDEDPKDPFNHYALALEYQKTDAAQAIHHFEILLHQFPDYLPTYYHAADFFAVNQLLVAAQQTYERGIALAMQQQNLKAHQELKNAYAMFLDEYLDE